MDITSFVEGISLSNDSFVTVKLKEGYVEDNAQLIALSEFSSHLFPCMRDRSSANTLIYDTNGFIPLDKYLSAAVFSAQGLQDFLLNLSGLERRIASSALRLSNTILKQQYIFINPYTKQVRFIYIPVSINTGISDSSSSLRILIKYVISNATCDSSYELIAFVLSRINSPSFSPTRFYTELAAFSPKTAKMIARKGRLRILGAVMLTLIFTAASSIGIPVLADFLNYEPIERYFTDEAILVFAILFGAAAVASIMVACIIAITLSSKSKLPKAQKAPKPQQTLPYQPQAPQYNIAPGVTASCVPGYPAPVPVPTPSPEPLPAPVPVPMPIPEPTPMPAPVSVPAEPELAYSAASVEEPVANSEQVPEESLDNIVIDNPVE